MPREVLADVYALRRKVYLFVYFAVYMAVLAYIPLGFSPVEVALVCVVSTIVAGAAIHLSFQRIIQLSKRVAYPSLFMVGSGDGVVTRDVAQAVLSVAGNLLSPQTAFISMNSADGRNAIVAVRGMSVDAAADRLERHAVLIQSAIDARYPREVPSVIGDIHEVIVPLMAMRKPIGLLYLAGRPGSHDMRDRSLLAGIGATVGMALANITGKEMLLQKEARLRSVITGAPVVLFSVDIAGVIAFMQGQGIARFGIAPEQVVGRPVEDVFSSYPQVLQGFRRALAGDNVVSSVTIGLNDQQVTYEYRLQPERNEKGLVTGVIGVAHDVSERRRAEGALMESQRALERLVGNLPGFAYRCRNNRDWTMEYVSEGVEDITGYTPDDFLAGRPHFNDVIHPDDRESVWADVQKAVDAQEKYLLEYRLVARNGSEVWVWEHGQAVYDDDGEVVALEGFLSDVTARKIAEQALLESEQRYRDLFENARDAVYTYDRMGRLVEANERWAQMTGYSLVELAAMNVGELLAQDSHIRSTDTLTRAFGGAPYEIDIVRKDGAILPIEVAMRVVFDDGDNVKWVQGIARDVSERRQAEDTIRRLAYNDALTGLPNRALMEDRVNVALAQARRDGKDLAVMLIDLDHFKIINDTLDHNSGDRLLQSVARDLLAIVRDGDTVARVGGDEFAVILPSIDRIEDATDIAEHVLESLRRKRTIDGREFRTTGSIGITTFPGDAADVPTLLRNADTAMNRAKEHGRDNYQLYTPAMNDRVQERLALESDLGRAVDRQEVLLHYQPIIDTETGALCGAEALLRWNHPERGSVPPDRFIPFAEETGQIISIGEWVLRRACEQLRDWEGSGYKLPRMAVNLSARQLQQEDLVERIEQIVATTGVSPHSLQLEITEGAVLRDEDRIISTLAGIRRMGVGIALDDFGTGYSSLTYLKRFPVDAVKIDRSFVRDLDRDANDAAIVSTVIAMAENLRLRVIAEGVESEEQLAFLRDRRCHEFQGYLVSPPVPPEEFEAFLRNGRLHSVPVNGHGKGRTA